MRQTIDSIRKVISLHKGVKVVYRAANGRRKIEERIGIIKDTYPSLFTVFIESQKSTISFSYSDILTGEVELHLESSGESLI